MQAPQGCGKTTLVEQLEYLFDATGSKAASVSIDDFYLTFEDQQALAKVSRQTHFLSSRAGHLLDLYLDA